MICYRDQTYCPFYNDCKKAKDCFSPLTQEVKDAAIAAHMPISQFIEKPECHTDFDIKPKKELKQ